jgi:hypothetical protein
MILGLALDEASAKVRTGPPCDDEEDYKLPIWAGIVPLQVQALPPIGDPRLATDLSPPKHVTGFRMG